jgi:hypothetical protein
MYFSLPTRLNDLLASGIWPGNESIATAQNIRSLIPPDRVRQFAPEEDRIYLQAPPFRTIADEVANSTEAVKSKYWNTFGALDQIDLDRALILGDFGLGSDAPIILNYALNPKNPPVFRLRFLPDRTTQWAQIAHNFDEFVKLLGL